MKDNSLNNKKIIAAYVGMVALALLAWFTVYQLSQPKTKYGDDVATNVVTNMPTNQLDNILMDSGYSEEAVEEMSEMEKEQAVLSNHDYRYQEAANKQYSSATNASEYDEAASKDKYIELLEMIEMSNYNFAASQVEDILMRFNLTTETNMKLTNIMSDAIIMANYDGLGWEQKEISLKSFKNPETFVLGVLKAYPRRREVVVWDKNSLSPVSVGVANIISSSRLDEESAEFKANALFSGDTRNVYRVDFSFGEFEALHAYVLESHDRKLTLSGIYSDIQYEYLRSVAWWIERGKDREKGV